MNNVDLKGLRRLTDRVRRLENLDVIPLMASFMKIIEEDNRKGVLGATDKDGGYMLAVTYRPKRDLININARETRRQRNNAKGRTKTGSFAGLGYHSAGLNNNLHREEYESLDGPPLAPRRQFSRVITNLRTAFERNAIHVWTAYGAWFEVVDKKGRSFLSAHFNGTGHLPKRDLRGVRPEGRRKARRTAMAWMRDQVRFLAGSSAA